METESSTAQTWHRRQYNLFPEKDRGSTYERLYKQAGNSIAVPIFESIFRKIILREEKTKKDDSERQEGDAGR